MGREESTYEAAAAVLLGPQGHTSHEVAEACLFFASRASAATGPRFRIAAEGQEEVALIVASKLWEGLRRGTITIRQSPFGYVARVTANECQRYARQHLNWVELTDTMLSQMEALTTHPAASEESVMLIEGLHELPIKQARALVLCDYYGLSVAEAGRMLGLPHSTVTYARDSGRAKMRRWGQGGERA